MSKNSYLKPAISQFVSDIISFSSEYTSSNGACRNLIGPPKCLNKYGDRADAWCPAKFNRLEFVEVEFEREVYVEKIRVYENLNGGCLVRVDAFVGDSYVNVWMRDRAELKRSYQVYEVVVKDTARSYRSRRLKVYLDCTLLKYYTQMDAIELIGIYENEKRFFQFFN